MFALSVFRRFCLCFRHLFHLDVSACERAICINGGLLAVSEKNYVMPVWGQ
jgi:hypothetical protein